MGHDSKGWTRTGGDLQTTPHTPVSGGAVAPGPTPPLGSDGATICDPNISGPHQWPLNVSTKGDFYPDPNQTPTATVKPDPDSRTGLEVTVKIKGRATPYPGQTPP